MPFRTESRITIADSVDEVWAYMCDVGRWPEWAPTVLEGRVRGGGALQPGSRVEQRAKLPLGLSRSRSQEVTLVEAPVTWRSPVPWVRPRRAGGWNSSRRTAGRPTP